MEIPFAGHPVIGTLIALADGGTSSPMTLELGVGPLACTVKDGMAAFTTSAPLAYLAKPEPELVARALGLDVADIVTDTHTPTQATLGLPFVITQIKDRATLSRCLPATDVLREGAVKHPAGMDFAQFVYCRDGNEIDARMFAPLDNIPEDPATGSASATLAALLTEALQMPLSLIIRQGYDMGRPSDITATTTMENPVAVTISGRAVKTLEGRFVF
jgi:trans-2,3-dihydro-3-hydroxyanthranilate isomerase